MNWYWYRGILEEVLIDITEQLRTTCDLMHLFFVFDDYSDPCGPSEVRELANIVMDAIRNPHKPRPTGEWVGGEVARQ